jgi:hypothetical protein
MESKSLFYTHFSFAEPAGFRLRNAFIHFVFIVAVLVVDIFRSARGEPGSILLRNSSFWNFVFGKKDIFSFLLKANVRNVDKKNFVLKNI